MDAGTINARQRAYFLLFILGERDRGNDRLDKTICDGEGAAGNLEWGRCFMILLERDNRGFKNIDTGLDHGARPILLPSLVKPIVAKDDQCGFSQRACHHAKAVIVHLSALVLHHRAVFARRQADLHVSAG
jgi:hypothetical protein